MVMAKKKPSGKFFDDLKDKLERAPKKSDVKVDRLELRQRLSEAVKRPRTAGGDRILPGSGWYRLGATGRHYLWVEALVRFDGMVQALTYPGVMVSGRLLINQDASKLALYSIFGTSGSNLIRVMEDGGPFLDDEMESPTLSDLVTAFDCDAAQAWEMPSDKPSATDNEQAGSW